MYARVFTAEIKPAEPLKAYVGDDGIYVPNGANPRYYSMLISRELFVEAYNKWIKEDAANSMSDADDADCWSDD